MDVRDAITAKSVQRDVALEGVPSDGRALTVALAADELLRASWAELAIRTAPPPRAPVPPEVRDTVRDALPSVSEARPPRFAFGADAAVEAFAAGTTLLGADVVADVWIVPRVRLGGRVGLRSGLVVHAADGDVSTSALLFGLGAAVTLTPPALRVGLDATLRAGVIRVSFAATPSGASTGQSLADFAVVGDAGVAFWVRLARNLRASAEVAAVLPLRPIDATDSGAAVGGISRRRLLERARAPGDVLSRDTIRASRGTWVSCALSLVVSACAPVSLEVLSGPAEAGAGDADASEPGDVAVDAPTCEPIGSTCTLSDRCCSGFCALDSRGQQTCRPTNGCAGAGASCSAAADCCTLACATAADGGTCQSEGLCSPANGPCVVDADCCSNACTNGSCAKGPGCSPAGEACVGDPDCCGGLCATSTDGTDRCVLLQGCRVNGEVCTSGSACCSGTCGGNGRCAPPSACNAGDGKGCARVIDDLCNTDNDCCSRKCLASNDGPKRCAPTRRLPAALRALRRGRRLLLGLVRGGRVGRQALREERVRRERRGVQRRRAVLRHAGAHVHGRPGERRRASMRARGVLRRRRHDVQREPRVLRRRVSAREREPLVRERVRRGWRALHDRRGLLRSVVGVRAPRRRARLRGALSLNGTLEVT